MTAPLIMLHGWGMTPKAWNPQRICLSPMSFNAPALPGHTGCGSTIEPTFAAWADSLAPELESDPCVLAGWSMGAMLALELARRYPERVRRLILFSATPCFVKRPVSATLPAWTLGLDRPTVEGFINGFARDPDATLQRFVHLQILGGSKRRGIIHTLNRALPQPEQRDLRTLADGLDLLCTTDLRERVDEITQPTVLIHGRQDALMPLDAARWLRDAIPNARLVTFDECGHAPFIAYPEACAELIKDELVAA